MQVARTIAALRDARRDAPAPVGLVPTMGALHAGHLSLVDRARDECGTVVASLFVNPTQFGPSEDFDRYPRDEARDLALFEEHGVAVVFAPSVDEMYPDGATSPDGTATAVRVKHVAECLEGAHRPGHFDGVATVVAKLLNIVQPDRAYFGQKDAQQLVVIRQMVRDLHVPVEIVGCPTVREPDGLALSSRNGYLSAEERGQAPALAAGLRRAEQAFADGMRDAERLRLLVRETIEAQPLAVIDYVSLADPATLDEFDGHLERPALLSLAVRFGGTRLIDNAILTP